MARPKGSPKLGGRQKGTPNKTTQAAKEAIAEVFERMGGADALLTWSKDNQERFYTVIWPKIVPLSVGGDKDNPLITEIVQRIVRS